MKIIYSFRMRLIIYMLFMAIILVSIMGTLQYMSQHKVLIESKKQNQALLVQKSLEAVNYIDDYYGLYKKNVETRMYEVAETVNMQYEKTKDIDHLNIEELKGKYNEELYIIDRKNTVIKTTFKQDLDLDFKRLPEFSAYLDDIREKGTFTMGGMNISITSPTLKIYAYYPTKDRKYIIEVSIEMEADKWRIGGKTLDSEILSIKNSSSNIESVNIIFGNGVSLTRGTKDEYYSVKDLNKSTFKKAWDTKTKQYNTETIGSHTYTYVYLPYHFDSYGKAGKDVIIELKFNSFVFENALAVNARICGGMVIFAVLLSIGFALFISRVITKSLSAMTAGLREISSGHLTHITGIESKDEFRLLGDSFNTMVDRVRSLLEEIQSNYLSTVKALANAIEASDTYTKGHCERVTRIGIDIGQAMNLSEHSLVNLEFAGLLHDIGKIGIPEAVLNKNGKLTESEFQMIKTHPEIGFKILEGVEFLEKSRKILRQHHERMDGTGYPLSIKGEEILLESKILAVADAYDAMTSARPYREKPLTTEQARRELQLNKGVQFDPEVVEIFLEILNTKMY